MAFDFLPRFSSALYNLSIFLSPQLDKHKIQGTDELVETPVEFHMESMPGNSEYQVAKQARNIMDHDGAVDLARQGFRLLRRGRGR